MHAGSSPAGGTTESRFQLTARRFRADTGRVYVSPTSIDMAKHRATLTAAAELIVKESGSPTSFDGGKWLNEWLIQPVPALGWKWPVNYLRSDEGCEVLIKLRQRSKTVSTAEPQHEREV